MTIILKKEKVGAHCSVSDDLFLHVDKVGRDYVRDTLTCRINAFILSRINETQEVTVFSERPTFFEWITRKKRRFTFKIECKEVMKNPPTLPESVMFYEVKTK